jgi:2-keto-4-pentenoate hydratase/2-oxohepta-3-ene-1,7-dioic acid hydratase in catechol pathway
VRLVTYTSDAGPRAGLLRDDEVVDPWDLLGGGGSSLRELLGADRLADLAEADGPTMPLDEVELLPPIPDPEKIIGIGLNYAEHAKEGRTEPPSSPTFFAKFRNALRPDGATVELPAASEKVDYEAEIAFVVGRRAKDVPESDAIDHIAGYTLFNDLSARDLQFATPQWMPGKVFDGAAPCGPAIVTPDEAGPHDALEIALDLNGERMQEARTDDLIFSIPALLSHLSSLMTLEPGDIVATGTPAGVGGAREPRVWLKPGDELVVSSPQLGRLVTRIAG